MVVRKKEEEEKKKKKKKNEEEKEKEEETDRPTDRQAGRLVLKSLWRSQFGLAA
jgi:hypothetical protein